MRIYLTHLGCKLNSAEIEGLTREIALRGHEVVASPAHADWAVINTCTVTHIAARKSRQAIRALYRQNPGLRIAAIGCYAEMSPNVVGALPGVALVVPNADKEHVLERILALSEATDEPSASPVILPPRRHTRAFVKVQDGCDNRCSYCIVTIARGPAISRPPQGILAEIRGLCRQGLQEIVLTGVNLGSYGRDRGPTAVLPSSADWSLARLVRTILAETPIRRLRLSSIEPWDVDDALLALWPEERLCRHLHLPLQSGSDSVLRRMNRHYDTQRFARTVACLRERIPNLSLSTDLIVGFPGETDETFAQSLAYVERIGFARLHVFRYSARPGTAAAQLPAQVHPETTAERSRRMTALGRRLALAYHQRQMNTTVEVLFEERQERDGRSLWGGLTDTYIRVEAASDEALHNCLRSARITAAGMNGVHAELLP